MTAPLLPTTQVDSYDVAGHLWGEHSIPRLELVSLERATMLGMADLGAPEQVETPCGGRLPESFERPGSGSPPAQSERDDAAKVRPL